MSASEYIAKAIEYISIKEVSDIMDYNDVNKYVEIVLEKNSFLVDNIIPDFLTAADLKYLLTCLIREKKFPLRILFIYLKKSMITQMNLPKKIYLIRSDWRFQNL